MTPDEVRALQGQVVSVALVDQTRVDEGTVLGEIAGEMLWLHSNGEDRFIDLVDVVDVWVSF